jgi:hypothetical protein
LAAAFALGCQFLPLPSPAAVAISGSIAEQPDAPVKIVNCIANVDGPNFVPSITFDTSGANQVTSSIVRYQFFDVANGALQKIDVAPPYAPLAFPSQATSFTCSATRENFANGASWGTSPGGRSVLPYAIWGAVAVGFLLLVLHPTKSIYVPPVTTGSIPR